MKTRLLSLARERMYKDSHLAVVSEIYKGVTYDEIVYCQNNDWQVVLAYKGHNKKAGDIILVSGEFVIDIKKERHVALLWEVRGVLMHLKYNSDEWFKRLLFGREINKLYHKHKERMSVFKTVGGL